MPATRRFILFALPLMLLLMACAGAAPTPSLQPHPTQAAAATQAPAAATHAPVMSTVTVSEAGGVAAQPPAANQMIIKNATLVLTVRDVDQALSALTTLTADNGGYLISSETWVESDMTWAELYLAVPSARFEAALNQLRRLALKVEHETTSGQDVSAEYTDLRSQLTNLEATAARVRAFLDDAATVEESLHINSELSRLEGDIERITGQMRYYEGRAAYSTITLSLRPEAAPVEAAPAWNPGTTVERAANVAVVLLQSGVDLVIWLGIVFGPPAVVLALALLALRLVLRRRGAKPA